MRSTHKTHQRRKLSFLLLLSSLVFLLSAMSAQAQFTLPEEEPAQIVAPAPTPVCNRTIKASVVALDQAIMFNRLGAVNPGGMIYALKQDIVAIDSAKGLVAGNVRLRSDKRPS